MKIGTNVHATSIGLCRLVIVHSKKNTDLKLENPKINDASAVKSDRIGPRKEN
jgi:hypothetical protein